MVILDALLNTDNSTVYRLIHGMRAIWVYEVVKLARIFDVFRLVLLSFPLPPRRSSSGPVHGP